MKKVLFLSIMLVVILGLVSVVAAQDDYKILRVTNGTTDVPTLDPAIAQDNASIEVLLLLAPGMTVPSEVDASPQPGIATSWDIVANEDGTATYTFHLMEELSWVRYDNAAGAVVQATDDAGNVRYVTANDIKYGIIRTITPETAAPYIGVLLPHILNAEAYYSGEVGAEELGIEVIDDYTIAITAPFLFAAHPSIFGMWICNPMPQWAIEAAAELWVEPESYQSYGPYTMKEWVHGDHITVVANPFWPGTDTVSIPAIDEVQLFNMEQSTALTMFEAGDMDHLDSVLVSEMARIKSTPELAPLMMITPGTAVYYYGYNTTMEPTNNVHMRRALSLAIDRESIVQNVTQGGQIPAPFYTLPTITAAPNPDDYPDLGVWYNPDEARAELQAYFDETGYTLETMPPLVLGVNTNESHIAIAEAVQQMWRDVLGLESQVTNVEWAVYLEDRIYNLPVWRSGWGYDYPDAHNYLYDVFYTNGGENVTPNGNNDTWWWNPDFEALLEQAMVLSDPAERAALYAQADNILVYEDAAIAPIYYYVNVEMTQATIERNYAANGNFYYFNWDITE